MYGIYEFQHTVFYVELKMFNTTLEHFGNALEYEGNYEYTKKIFVEYFYFVRKTFRHLL